MKFFDKKCRTCGPEKESHDVRRSMPCTRTALRLIYNEQKRTQRQIFPLIFLVTARKRSLGQGNIFAPVCHSVHRGGVCLSACWDTTPLEQTPPWSRHPPQEQTPPGSRPPRADPPGADTPRSKQPREQTPPGSRHPPGADTPLGSDPPWSRHPPRCRTC